MQQHYDRFLLSASLSSTLGRAINDEDCAHVLSALEDRFFHQLDQQLRERGWYHQSNAMPDPISDMTEAGLFIKACSRNGFDRQQALLDFQQKPGYLATAAALLRGDDWVPQVQAQAIALLKTIFADNSGSLFRFLDLLMILRERTRFSEQVWEPLIAPLMQRRSAATVDAWWAATAQSSTRARLFSYQMLAREKQDIATAAMLRAAEDLAPSVALWGLSAAMGALSTTTALTAIKCASRHPSAVVRAQGLRLHAQHDAANAREAVDAALFASTYALRSEAIHLSKTCYDQSPLDRYRAAIDSQDQLTKEIAVIALADMATAEDAARLRPSLYHRRAELRIAALRGLARARPDDLRLLVNSALTDSSSKVVRQALIISQREGWLSRDLLENAYLQATVSFVQQTLVRATRGLDKWNALALLLQWHLVSERETHTVVKRELVHWISSELNRFTALTPGLRSEIEKLLEQQSAGNPYVNWGHIAFAVQSS